MSQWTLPTMRENCQKYQKWQRWQTRWDPWDQALVATFCCSHINSFGVCIFSLPKTAHWLRGTHNWAKSLLPKGSHVDKIHHLKGWTSDWNLSAAVINHCSRSKAWANQQIKGAAGRWVNVCVCVFYGERNRKEHRAERWPGSDEALLASPGLWRVVILLLFQSKHLYLISG